MSIVVSFQTLKYFKKRYPRRPETLTLAESKNAVGNMLNDAHDLGLSRKTLSAITAIVKYLQDNPAASRTAYERGRSALYYGLNEADPSPVRLTTLDPDGGYRCLNVPDILHIQPATGPGTESIAVLAPQPPIPAEAIAYAKKRLVGCPEGPAGTYIRDAALAPLVRPLMRSGNTSAAIGVWLRMAGFRPQLGKISARSVAPMVRRIAQNDDDAGEAMAGWVVPTQASTGVSASL